MKIFPKQILILALFLIISLPAFAQDNWSAWQDLGEGVSISWLHLQTGNTTTWRIRNNGPTTITYLSFNYTDQTGTYPDLLPYSLKPMQWIGGWAVFSGTGKTSVHITSIQRK